MLASIPPLSTIAGWLCLVFALGWGTRKAYVPEGAPRPRWWLWWLSLGAVLLCFRWPVIALAHELYPDESQLLAGALTLRHDPLFWRSVDGNTAGPLDYYVLLPATFFHDVTAYVATRVIAAVLLWGALVAAGEALVRLTGQAVARLATLPALLFLAFTTSPEFLHYSTELVPAFLLALAVLELAMREHRPTRANLWATALLLGAVPWAKLQAVPIAVVLGLFLVVREVMAGRRGEAALTVAAASVPTLAVLLLLAATGQTQHMVVPYIAQNLLYAASGRLPVSLVIAQQWSQAVTNGYLAAWLAGSGAFALLAAAGLLRSPPPLRRVAVATAGLLAVAIGATLAPGRPYSHYLHFLAVPLTLSMGALLVATRVVPSIKGGRGSWGLISLALCLLVPLLVLRLLPRDDPYAYYNNVVTAPSPGHQALVAQVRLLARPGEALGLWGWRSSLYVETGLIQATCQAHTESVLIDGPIHSYYLQRYIEKLVEHAPPVFVDAVGPGNFRFQDRALGHEVFPFLRQWIQEHYVFVAEHDGCRIYVRRDRARKPAP